MSDEIVGCNKKGREVKVKFTDGAWWAFERISRFWSPIGSYPTKEAGIKAAGLVQTC